MGLRKAPQEHEMLVLDLVITLVACVELYDNATVVNVYRLVQHFIARTLMVWEHWRPDDGCGWTLNMLMLDTEFVNEYTQKLKKKIEFVVLLLFLICAVFCCCYGAIVLPWLREKRRSLKGEEGYGAAEVGGGG